MVCPSCGTKNPGDVRECLYCGRPLPGLPELPFSKLAPVSLGLSLVSALCGLTVTGLLLYAYCAMPTAVASEWEESRVHPLISFGFWAAVAAWLIASVVRASLERRARRLRGARMARAAASIAAFGGLVTILSMAVFPMAERGEAHVRKTVCSSRLTELAAAIGMYAADYGALPPSSSWCDALTSRDVATRQFGCPEAPGLRSGYAYNASLDGLAPRAVVAPEQTILLFESDLGWDARGGPEVLPALPRHIGGDNLGFVDGHSKWCSRKHPGSPPRGRWVREYNDEELIWRP